MPYTVNRLTYAVAPYFIWQKSQPEPLYHHAVMRDFYINYELRSFESGTNGSWFFATHWNKAFWLWIFYLVRFSLSSACLPSSVTRSQDAASLVHTGSGGIRNSD